LTIQLTRHSHIASLLFLSFNIQLEHALRETLEKVACMEGKLSAAEGSRKKLLSDVDALMLIKSQHAETQYALEKVRAVSGY
jgi:hypothetical protein